MNSRAQKRRRVRREEWDRVLLARDCQRRFPVQHLHEAEEAKELRDPEADRQFDVRPGNSDEERCPQLRDWPSRCCHFGEKRRFMVAGELRPHLILPRAA